MTAVVIVVCSRLGLVLGVGRCISFRTGQYVLLGLEPGSSMLLFKFTARWASDADCVLRCLQNDSCVSKGAGVRVLLRFPEFFTTPLFTSPARPQKPRDVVRSPSFV